MDQPARRVAYGSLNSECRCLKLVDTFRNDVSQDASWLAEHGGEQAPYAICWLEYLSPADTLVVNALPPSDSVSGDTSDNCD